MIQLKFMCPTRFLWYDYFYERCDSCTKHCFGCADTKTSCSSLIDSLLREFALKVFQNSKFTLPSSRLGHSSKIHFYRYSTTAEENQRELNPKSRETRKLTQPFVSHYLAAKPYVHVCRNTKTICCYTTSAAIPVIVANIQIVIRIGFVLFFFADSLADFKVWDLRTDYVMWTWIRRRPYKTCSGLVWLLFLLGGEE